MFDVEQADNCQYDRLTIYDGNSTVEKSRMCGAGSKAFTSRGNKVFMRFTSDNSVTKKGFYGTYQTVDKCKFLHNIIVSFIVTAKSGFR